MTERVESAGPAAHGTGAADPEIALDIRDLHKHFGGIKAVNGCSLAFPRGRISGLIGPNGSGKTTMFNLMTGIAAPDRGTVSYRGENLVGFAPHEISRRGIVRTFQITRVYREMTVYENMLSVCPLRVPERKAKARAEELLAFVNLMPLRDEYGGNLSYGQQKLLEFARALMPDPQVILLDEPAAGVNRTLLADLLERIGSLRKSGKTVVIIEHDMHVIMNHCDRIFVMDHGAKIAEGTAGEIRQNERVIEAYFGSRRHGAT